MIGPKAMSNYSKFVSDLVDTLEPEYCDARQSLQSSSASAERCIWQVPETHGVLSWSGPGDGPQGKTKDCDWVLQAFGELESMKPS